MEHPLKPATPADVVDTQPDRVPEPEAIAKVMAFVSVVTVLLPASSMVRTGWAAKGVLATAPAGWS